jgi:hypothetical protein
VKIQFSIEDRISNSRIWSANLAIKVSNFFPLGKMRWRRDEMPGPPTVWSALNNSQADAWRSQGLDIRIKLRQKHLAEKIVRV